MSKPDMDKIRHIYLDLPKGAFRDEFMPALLDYVEALEKIAEDVPPDFSNVGSMLGGYRICNYCYPGHYTHRGMVGCVESEHQDIKALGHAPDCVFRRAQELRGE